MKKLLLLASIFLLGIAAYAQNTGGTQVAQQGTRFDAPTQTAVASGASPQTLTIAAQGTGLSIYICSLDFSAWTTAAPTAGAGTFTSTGLTNNLVYTFEFAATANINWNHPTITFSGTCLKVPPNTAFTFASSTFTSVSTEAHATYYVAP